MRGSRGGTVTAAALHVVESVAPKLHCQVAFVLASYRDLMPNDGTPGFAGQESAGNNDGRIVTRLLLQTSSSLNSSGGTGLENKYPCP